MDWELFVRTHANGLFRTALAVLQGAQQRAAGPNVTGEPAEELFFHAVDSVPFTDHGIGGGMKLIAMEQEDAAAFHVESGGKTYGVLYSVTADGERNAKEVVTKMVDYITQNGLFVEERETVTDTGVVGPYYLETEEDMGDRTFLPVVTFYQDGNFQCTSDLASSHHSDSHH